MASTPPYLVRVHLKEQAVQSEEYPFSLPIVRGLDIEFASPVTFFVGENGTGKSTIIEALAALCRLPVSGGGRNELAGTHGSDTVSPLCRRSQTLVPTSAPRRVLPPGRVPGAGQPGTHARSTRLPRRRSMMLLSGSPT
jgi:energy-coupling factor transporter ATP-binding protein EcfA2